MESEKSSKIHIGPRGRSIANLDLSAHLGKLPPQAPELEEAILGALMLEKDALSQVIEILKPEIFYKDAHSEIYAVIKELFEDSEPVDCESAGQRSG